MQDRTLRAPSPTSIFGKKSLTVPGIELPSFTSGGGCSTNMLYLQLCEKEPVLAIQYKGAEDRIESGVPHTQTDTQIDREIDRVA